MTDQAELSLFDVSVCECGKNKAGANLANFLNVYT